MDEEELRFVMIAGLQGDRAAYERALGAVAARVRRFVSRRLKSAHMATDIEDVVQMVLLAVHTRRDTYDQTRPLMPWVLGITHYKLLEHFRANRHRASEVALAPLQASLSTGMDGHNRTEAVDEITTLLHQIPRSQREALVLTKFVGHSVEEVAQSAGLTPGAIKLRIHRAIKALRKLAQEP